MDPLSRTTALRELSNAFKKTNYEKNTRIQLSSVCERGACVAVE